MQRIVPHLWFDREAVEATTFYTSIFPDSAITQVTRLEDTPSGGVDTVAFRLYGMEFQAISAGPLFRFTPALSFLVSVDSPEEVDRLYAALSPGGMALMPLDRYPFSQRYAWIQDRYGLSWQLYLDGQPKPRRGIVPTLMFVGENCGKAEEAMNFYAAKLPEGRMGDILRYGEGAAPDTPGTVQHGEFSLAGQVFGAMDSAYEHGFGFNEAISLMLYCENQEELDRYWERLSAVPEAEQCGWLKDRYGLSWQIVPREMDEMMRKGDPAQIARVTQAFLGMKKFDLAALRKAYAGR